MLPMVGCLLIASILVMSLSQDIAVMTNNASRCHYYQTESQNVKDRWECVLPFATVEKYVSQNLVLPNTQEECEVGLHETSFRRLNL